MGSRTRQLEEQDRELLKFHERIGDLWLKAENLKEQLEIERADRKDIEEEYWDKVEALTELRSQLSELQQNLATANQQLQEVTADRQQVEAQLSDLQKRLDEVEQNSAPVIDLSDKAGEVMNFFRTLLPKDTKLPKNTMTKLREILEATED